MKPKYQIRIIVAGLARAGKSTVIQIINEALTKHGIVSIGRTDGTTKLLMIEPNVEKHHQRKRVKEVGKTTLVEIEERQMYNSLMPGAPPRIQGIWESNTSVIFPSLKTKKRPKAQPRRKK